MTRYQPLWQQAGSYAAQQDRSLMAALWPAGGCTGGAVTTIANTMNVNVAPGVVAVPLQTGIGAALCRWDANEVVTLAAAPASGTSRIDVIVAQVRDNALDSGGNNDFIFAAVTGTAAASNPAIPATPNNAYAIAQVTVPGAAANLNGATITDVRYGPMTAGGDKMWTATGGGGTTSGGALLGAIALNIPPQARAGTLQFIAKLYVNKSVASDVYYASILNTASVVVAQSQADTGNSVVCHFVIPHQEALPANTAYTAGLYVQRAAGTGSATFTASSVVNSLSAIFIPS